MELTADRCDVECLHPEHVRPLLGRVVAPGEAESFAGIFELLADPTRARLLHALSLAQELCVCDLAEMLGVSVSAVSQHLAKLKAYGLVAPRRDAQTIYYRLTEHPFNTKLRDNFFRQFQV